MSFGFTHRKNVQAQVRAIAGEQIQKALEEARQPSHELGKTVHGLRRRCKKLRGLVRLVRPHLKHADRENAAFRDAAASLSQARDAAVMVETFATLLEFDRTEGGSVIADPEARRITAALGQAAQHSDAGRDEQFAQFSSLFEAAQRRVERWSFNGRNFDVVGDGLALNYKQFCKRLIAAEDGRSPESLHDWRKVAKYHGHHLNLLRSAAPEMIKGREEAVDALGDLLGDHHNLAVLDETLRKLGIGVSVFDAIEKQQRRMADAAFVLGRQLAAEQPKALHRRFESYWALLPEKG
ncbi:CHAD domain-containing protein [Devosia submarina]|uniref:CHAD domain-containing protein n=1 Tax=Devosia submarina TaxID=1173082 RepID=UPI000D38D785|nr:CHAD domain-containing protein [Devosia submarina]